MTRRSLKISLVLTVAVAAILGLAWLLGPREPVDLTLRFDPASIGADPVAYVAREDAAVPDLQPGATKEIVWAYPASRARTPVALVYIHGFTGTRSELEPVPELVAKRIGANLFLTRLTGHGRTGDAMAEASVNDWWNDLAEAVAIGRRLGERVVVMGTSTGGTLAVLGASDPALMRDVEGLVLVSPNFGVEDWRGFTLTLPFARWLGPRVFGEHWGSRADDPSPDVPWNQRYPTVALLPMGALVQTVAKTMDLAAIRLPALFVFSPNDTVVDPSITREAVARWTAPKEVIEIPGAPGASNHLVAGSDATPQANEMLAERIADWISRLPGG